MKFLLSILLCLGTLAHAGIVDKTIEVTTKEKNPLNARRELNEKAQAKAIEDMVLETIGEERFKKNKATIENKIVKLASRLIPFSKVGTMEPLPEGGFKMTVMLKVNQEEMDQALVQNGLFYEADVQPLILPLVSWVDKSDDSQAWSWWSPGNSTFLAHENSTLEALLRPAFLKNGFFVLRPQQTNSKEAVPSASVVDPSLSDIQSLAASRNAQVVLTGNLQILPSPTRSGGFLLDLKMAVLHVPRNRSIAQVARKVETDVGPKNVVVTNKLKETLESMVTDLSGQTLEAWQRGAAQSNSYRVTLSGSIPLNVQEDFREAFKTKAREVKAVRERMITSNGVTYEIDSVTGPKELAKRVSEIPVVGGKLVLKDASDSELRYNWVISK